MLIIWFQYNLLLCIKHIWIELNSYIKIHLEIKIEKLIIQHPNIIKLDESLYEKKSPKSIVII